MRSDPSLKVEAGPGVYPPSEDSLLLLESVDVRAGEHVVEVGTGTGLIALHAARVARTVATDVNPSALALARGNARRSGLGLELVRTDLLSALRGPFDVVIFNPPYLEGEPHDLPERATQGGTGGSAVAMRFLDDLPRILAPGGRAYLLLSAANTAARAKAEARFRVRTLASKPLFFERLDVVELRAP